MPDYSQCLTTCALQQLTSCIRHDMMALITLWNNETITMSQHFTAIDRYVDINHLADTVMSLHQQSIPITAKVFATCLKTPCQVLISEYHEEHDIQSLSMRCIADEEPIDLMLQIMHGAFVLELSIGSDHYVTDSNDYTHMMMPA